ncbi:MAG: BamA/TamA family outer membrane protein [Candidatus Margulisiibacteriota bacterium]|nr:BamA/TamA family outer membrane protein [Candidatus Margulisiibacteriota bacterium]
MKILKSLKPANKIRGFKRKGTETFSLRFLPIFLALFFLLFSFSAFAQDDTVEVSPIITGVNIKGNQNVPDQEIMDVIFSRIGDSLYEKKVQSDIKAVYGLGFFKDVTATFESEAGGTVVTFIVEENPKIEKIVFDGNTVYTSQDLLSLIKSRTGKTLNFKTLQEDIAKINSRYKDNGYILARVIDVETDEINNTLTIKIIEGIVESIGLEGNDNTKDYVIIRELKTQPGTVFNETKFKNDLRRVFNLGFFSEVNPKFEAGSTTDKVVIVLDIKETRTSTINFGGGYGEAEGWFGFIDLSLNNLMGSGQGIMIRGQSGQELSTYQFKYTNPWLMPERFGDHTSFTFRRWLTIGRDIYLTEQDARYNGWDMSVGKPLYDDYKIAWSLGSEVVSPHGSSTFESYQSDTVGLTLSYDTRDFWLNPTKGRFYSLSLKQGWKHSSGTTTFFKIGGDVNHYYPVQSNQVFATHIGSGIGFGDVPIGEEYWAGGANTVRGYYPSEARRGTRKLIFNAEYRLNFSELFQGVFFYDWGNAWNEGAPVPADFISGWGPGVRINTPLGPIRLDWGVPSGKAFGEGIMHFSIGQAF